jgi:DNA polymerase-3 subunit gamma/tau
MSYLVLARRWRPQQFDEVIGQHHVTQTLQNAIAGNRVAHAFLFSGARGIGKTTVARILAKALNCREGPTPHPCGRCESCREIAQGTAMDVQEIDGASNTGVDDVRELREGLRYRPATGRFRVYIIDEVHMLSNAAFNALLKTLEEPPPHVVFVFATTEPHKIPMTILSRCQRFDFKRIPLPEIVDQLSRISESEGIQVARDTLILIAREAQGSLRDAQSLLDQVISYAGEQITSEAVQEVLGLLDRSWLYQTSQALLQRDAKACLDVVGEIFQRGHSLTYFYHQLVEHMRNLMVVLLVPEAGDQLHLPDYEMDALRQQVEQLSAEDLHLWFDLLTAAEEDIRRTQYPRYMLEMLLVKMARLDRTQDLTDLVDRIQAIRRAGAAVAETSGEEAESVNRSSTAPPGEVPSLQKWNAFIQHVQERRPALASVLVQGRFLDCRDGKNLRVAFPTEFHIERVTEAGAAQVFAGLTVGFFGKDVRIAPVLDENNGQDRNASAKLDNHKLQVGVRSHPLVQEALHVFGGNIVGVRLQKDARRKSDEKEGG